MQSFNFQEISIFEMRLFWDWD